jgi:hypothetical protein
MKYHFRHMSEEDIRLILALCIKDANPQDKDYVKELALEYKAKP